MKTEKRIDILLSVLARRSRCSADSGSQKMAGLFTVINLFTLASRSPILWKEMFQKLAEVNETARKLKLYERSSTANG